MLGRRRNTDTWPFSSNWNRLHGGCWLLPLALLGVPEGSRLVHAVLDLDNLTINLAITGTTRCGPLPER
jgi:hypothetical protein